MREEADTMAKDELTREIEQLKKDLKDTRADIQAIARSVKVEAEDTGHSVAQRLKDEAAQRVEQIRHKVERAKQYGHEAVETAQHGVETAREKVEEHPLSVVIGGFLVGLLIGRWTKRG